MTKVSIEVNDDILKFIEQEGYELTKVDYANALFHVRKKIKYRDVTAPSDLGRVCEFSDLADFPIRSTVEGRLYSVGLQTYGPGFAYKRIGVDQREYLHCRVKDES